MRNLRSQEEIMASWQGNQAKPVVSICCITYNHELYIEDALEGFLIQETDFPFEILINDDASTDRTADIIREYEAKYEKLIKPIYQTENQYSKGTKINPVFNFPRAKGEYIALCEGDDYWTAYNKLQIQRDFLEKNMNYSICYHDVKVLSNGSFSKSHVPLHDNKDHLTIVDLAYENCIHTATCLFRNQFPNVIPDIFNKAPVGDYVLHMINAKYGKIKRLPKEMAVYRRHSEGVWSGLDLATKLNSWLGLLSLLITYFEHDNSIVKALRDQRQRKFKQLIENVATHNDILPLANAIKAADISELEILSKHLIKTNNIYKKIKNNAILSFIIKAFSKNKIND